MNKKFSTLLASVLLTSAFTVNAVTDPVAGDNVRLKLSSQYIGIDANDGLKLDNAKDPVNTEGGNFEAVNRQLWKIATIKKSSTGQEIYQFVNKWTGEYLAIKLKSNQKANTNGIATSTGTVKLDPAGNKDWAYDPHSHQLWAYDSATDTTYYLNSSLVLVAEKGNSHASAATLFPEKNENLKMPLNAKAFNKLMGLPGNNAMLNFNNSKDVTSTQTNQLKNVKWVADEKATDNKIFLTNGKTTEGSKVTRSGDTYTWSKIQKKMYLQIDTTYYDATTPNYLKLDVDTINYELDETEANMHKPKTKHPNALAEFAADYYFSNDSIALVAKNKPKKTETAQGAYVAESYSTEQSVLEGTFGSAQNALIAKKNTLTSAVAALKSDAQEWLTANVNATEDKTYATSANYTTKTENVTNAEYVNNAALGTYVGNFAGLKVTASDYMEIVGLREAYEAGLGENEHGSENYQKLMKAFDLWVDAMLPEEEDGTPINKKITEVYFNSDFTQISGTEDNDGGLNVQINTIETEGLETAESNIRTKIIALTAASENDMANTIEGDCLDDETGDIAAYSGGYNNEDALYTQVAKLKVQATMWYAAYNQYKTDGSAFTTSKFDNQNLYVTEDGTAPSATFTVTGTIEELTTLQNTLAELRFTPATGNPNASIKYFFDGENVATDPVAGAGAPVVLRSLADVTVLTVSTDGASIADPNGYVLPLIQPYATSGGDATDIATDAKVYNLQIKNVAKDYTLRANKLTGTYLVAKSKTKADQVDDVDASNVYAQWAFIPGTAGYYSIVNRAIPELVYYTGPVSKVKDEDGKVVADTYVLGTDTLKIAGVTLNEDNFYTEKVGNKNVQYDYSGAYYTGKTDGIYQTFVINPVSPFMSQLAAQLGKDSVLVLGDAEDALIWKLVEAKSETYGLEIDGLPQLKKKLYRICTTIGDDTYVIRANATTHQMELTKSDSYADDKHTRFELRNVAEGQYNFIANTEPAGSTTTPVLNKMTINATPAKPILEVSDLNSEKNDLFAMNKSQVTKYRKLTAEDGVLGNAKIYMENEPNRYLYENTANIVANNGNKIAKDSLNFLGIYNTAALTKNAALYVDTAYVEREGVYMPQYMFALGVTDVPAHEAIACTYEHNHFDNAGNKVDALHCSHATPATLGYKSGRYLVALTDSIDGVSKHPGRYDGEVRLAFVEAIHRNAEDSLIIKNSKWTDNNKQIVAGKETTYASKDTIKIEDNKLKTMTFALEIADQSTQSFYLATSGDKYVRILNGVPVLTGKKDDAAIFNIEATTEEATANEAIAAEGVQVVAGKGTVTVQGAAGKVITVANILGQTIANQVATSDNVTIAAPAGVVVVAVDGDATKVVVK